MVGNFRLSSSSGGKPAGAGTTGRMSVVPSGGGGSKTLARMPAVADAKKTQTRMPAVASGSSGPATKAVKAVKPDDIIPLEDDDLMDF